MRSGFCVIILTATIICAPALAYNWATNPGNGSPENPYQISEPNHLIAIGADPVLLDKHFILTNDIVFDPNNNPSHTFPKALIAPDVDEIIGGFQGTVFSGVLDGDGHVVKNLIIDGVYCCGLFGKSGEVAEIKNVRLENIFISGSNEIIGGLIGYNYGSVTGCYSSGHVSGGNAIGGLIGSNSGNVTNCYATATVNGSDYVGGLIGSNSGSVTDCCSVSNVIGDNYLGGLIGANKSNATDCCWNGTVDGTGTYIGGLMGKNIYGTVRGCHSNGRVRGDSYVGGLMGLNDANATVINCYSITTVDGYLNVGGLLGCIGGTAASVKRSYSISSVTGTYYAGGLIGSSNAPIYSCFSSGTVNGNSQTGGLIGKHSGYPLSYCYSASDVIGTDSSTGGLLGLCESSTVEFCYATGAVDGVTYTGGLIGIIDNHLHPTEIKNSYSTGSVSGTATVGGLIGYAYDHAMDEIKIERCYSAGHVTGIDRVGGLIGENHNIVTNCYWDIQTSGLADGVANQAPDPAGVVGLTTMQMKDKGNFISWDFEETWDIDNGQTYPFLLGFGAIYGGGNGTAEDPYQIWTAEQMHVIGLNNYDWNKSFKLMTDIDMGDYTGSEYKIIGQFWSVPFSGSFDGGNHIIYNLTYSSASADHAGLFGYTDIGVEIKNLGLENVNFTGANNVGGLVGSNSADIINCYLTGTIGGASNVGGLCGVNLRGTITNSYTAGVVNGNTYVGGLCGRNYNDGIVANCYSANTLNAEGYTGGLIGNNGGPVTSCYFLDTAGSDNGYGTPLDDPNMMVQTSFVGWDFVGESDNGKNEIWRMCVDGMDYPRLSWEFAKNGDFACGDGVDLADLQALAEYWLLVGTAHPTEFNYAVDANGDGKIDLSDFDILSENWP